MPVCRATEVTVEVDGMRFVLAEIAGVVAGDAGYQEAKRGSPEAIFGSVGKDRMGTEMMYDRYHACMSERTVREGKDGVGG